MEKQTKIYLKVTKILTGKAKVAQFKKIHNTVALLNIKCWVMSYILALNPLPSEELNNMKIVEISSCIFSIRSH